MDHMKKQDHSRALVYLLPENQLVSITYCILPTRNSTEHYMRRRRHCSSSHNHLTAEDHLSAVKSATMATSLTREPNPFSSHLRSLIVPHLRSLTVLWTDGQVQVTSWERDAGPLETAINY